MHILHAIVLGAGVLLSGTALAAEKCYETIPVEASYGCSVNGSNSADFTSNCSYVPEGFKEVEVDCPGQWVNISQATVASPTQPPSHAQVCSAKGLKPAKIGGMFCASGERPPRVGAYWESINYKYGKKGDGNGFKGGNDLDSKTSKICSNDCETVVTKYSLYCYENTTTKKNNTSEDAAVAFYCE